MAWTLAKYGRESTSSAVEGLFSGDTVTHSNCCSCHSSRRGFLTGLAALGGCTTVPGFASAAVSLAKPRRIDVHHHLLPPTVGVMTKSKNMLAPAWNGWTPETSLADMDRGGVDIAMLSITTPGIWFGNVADSAGWARESNDFGAKMMADHPNRFGLFTTLPMPDIDATLKEIAYGLDVLKADGVAMFTNYGDKWLGDPTFDPVFAELNQRKAVVYTHPNIANCCRNLVPDIPPAMVELGTDTTRAIAQMIFGGASRRFPDIRIIFSHAGGTMPYLIGRFAFEEGVQVKKQTMLKGQLDDIKAFYYDTAQSTSVATMTAFRKVIPVSQLLFGTDYPFRTTIEHVEGLKYDHLFTARELRAIDRDNAIRLLARFKAQAG